MADYNEDRPMLSAPVPECDCADCRSFRGDACPEPTERETDVRATREFAVYVTVLVQASDAAEALDVLTVERGSIEHIRAMLHEREEDRW